MGITSPRVSSTFTATTSDNDYTRPWVAYYQTWLPTTTVTMFADVPAGTYELKYMAGTDGASAHTTIFVSTTGGSAHFSIGRSITDEGYFEHTMFIKTSSLGNITTYAPAPATVLRPVASIRRIYAT